MAGTIVTRKNGKYQLKYMYNGKRHTKTITIKDTNTKTIKNKLDRALMEYVLEVESQNEVKKDMYFKDYAQKWLDEYVRKNLEQKTIEFYKYLINGRISDKFDNYLLSQISRSDVIDFLNSLTVDYTQCTIKKFRNCLVTMFNYAIKIELLENNPATLVDLPKGKVIKRKKNVYDNIEDISELLNRIKKVDIKKRLIVEIAVKVGARREEIMALNIKDFDFTNKTVSINKALVYTIENGMMLKNTKNNKSRIIAIQDSILELVKECNKNEKGDLFYDVSVNYISRWFTKFINKEKLPYVSLHGLRHSHATWLIANKVDIKTVSNRLGHSNASVTLNIYTHRVKENDIKASALFEI